LGWTTQKINHALRDLVASKLTMKYGLDAARDWCRHSQQATTEKHYNRFRRRSEQLDTKKLAWLKWAKKQRRS
jgi:integrase